MKIRISGLTDAGKVRDNNEDALLFCEDLEKQEWQDRHTAEYISLGSLGTLLIVADGMGGANAGEVASSLAIESIKNYFSQQRAQSAITQDLITEMLQRSIVSADQVINHRMSEDPTSKGMGTTIVVCWVIGKTAHVAWCGDSRCYVYKRKKGLQRLTIDHSYVQELIDKGELTEEEAFNHPENNIITRGLGDFQAYPTADIVNFDIKRGDTIMLCSDGLCGYCTDEEMEKVMKENYQDVDADCEKLMQLAMDAGGQDNITVLIASLIGDKDSCPPKPKKSFFSRLFG